MGTLHHLNEPLIEDLERLVREGARIPTAFTMAGIPESTRTRWQRRARGAEGTGHPLLDELWQRLQQAETDGRQRRIAVEKHERALKLEALKHRVIMADLAASGVSIAPTPPVPPPVRRIIPVKRRRGRRSRY